MQMQTNMTRVVAEQKSSNFPKGSRMSAADNHVTFQDDICHPKGVSI
jgi:hypothetical protein